MRMPSAAFVLSPATRRRAMLLLQHGSVSRLDPEARIVYAVSLVIADGEGCVDRAALATAATDPALRAIAKELLRRALR